jgi:hypothetical protein
MRETMAKNPNSPIKPDRASGLRYESEDEGTYIVSDDSGARLRVPKKRGVSESALDRSSSPITPVSRLLLAAFFGLAPAGLGTLVMAPPAMVWALALFFTRPLSRADRVRVMVVCGIAAVLLGIAIPASRLFLDRFS